MEAMEAVMAMDEHYLDGKLVECKYAVPKE